MEQLSDRDKLNRILKQSKVTDYYFAVVISDVQDLGIVSPVDYVTIYYPPEGKRFIKYVKVYLDKYDLSKVIALIPLERNNRWCDMAISKSQKASDRSEDEIYEHKLKFLVMSKKKVYFLNEKQI